MTAPENKPNQPDIESIIKKIREDIHETSLASPPVDEKALSKEEDLQGNLNIANASYLIGKPRKGLKGRIRQFVLKPFSILFLKEIIQFNSSVVLVLNKLVKILEGGDSSTCEVIDKMKRRVDLLEKLSRRLDAYDDLKVEERLKKIERQMEEARQKDTH